MTQVASSSEEHPAIDEEGQRKNGLADSRKESNTGRASDSTFPPQRSNPIGMPEISIADLAMLSEEDFETVWNALGKVFRVKGKQEMVKSSQNMEGENNTEKEE